MLGLAAIALAGCTPATRDNIFVSPSLGREARAPGAETADAPEPGLGVVPDVRRDSSAIGARRPAGEVRRPVIRLAPEPEASRTIPLREPVRIGADGTVTMSFERVGVQDFVRAVFGETLGLDYTLAPGVTGSISLQISRPVPREAVLPIAERALAQAGVAVRRDGDLLVVEPDPRGPAVGGPATTLVVRRLSHVDRAQMEQALQPFLAPDARLAAGPLPDTLILSGSEAGVEALDDLVELLDADPLADRSFGLFPLRMASAAQVADELRAILGADAPAGPEVIEIERMNGVLVITESRDLLDEATFWVRQLDQTEALGTQIHVYQVQNRRAGDLAELLQQALAAGQVGAIAAPTPEGVAPGLTELAVGEAAAAAEAPAAAAPAQPARSGPLANVTVFADEGTNSVMTIATPEQYAVVHAALRRLDIQPVQVLIEATIIEVTLADELRYGVRWFFEHGDVSLSFSDFASGAVAPVFPGFNFVLDTKNVQQVVSALDAVTDIEVVSSPSLMVLNNEAARLQIGDEVPVPTTTAVGVTDPLAPIVNQIEFRDTGVILEITPRVNESGVVLLDVVQEVSDVAPTTSSGIDAPTISQRQFQSSVLLRDRETLALGGLIRTNRSRGRTGIPILSDIPILGAVFGATDLVADRTELLVVLRPIVVRNHNEARAAYQELRSKLRGLEDLDEYLPPD